MARKSRPDLISGPRHSRSWDDNLLKKSPWEVVSVTLGVVDGAVMEGGLVAEVGVGLFGNSVSGSGVSVGSAAWGGIGVGRV